MGTVDAWAGPAVRNAHMLGTNRETMKVLESGPVRRRMSDRTRNILTFGMVVSMGIITGWALFTFKETTRAEGSVFPSENGGSKTKKFAAAPVEEKEKRPGVFVWGSNRFISGKD